MIPSNKSWMPTSRPIAHAADEGRSAITMTAMTTASTPLTIVQPAFGMVPRPAMPAMMRKRPITRKKIASTHVRVIVPSAGLTISQTPAIT